MFLDPPLHLSFFSFQSASGWGLVGAGGSVATYIIIKEPAKDWDRRSCPHCSDALDASWAPEQPCTTSGVWGLQRSDF